MLNVQFLFNYLNGIWIFLQIRIQIFFPESWIFGFGFENFLTTNKIRIQIPKISGLRRRFWIRIRSKKRTFASRGGGSIRPPLLNAILLSRLAGMPTQVWLIAFITYPSCSPYVLLHGFVFSFVHSRNPLQIAQMSSSFEMVLFGNRKTHK